MPNNKTTTINSKDYIFFQIKPFKENDFGIEYWDNLLKNLTNAKEKKIVCIVSWNNQNLKLFICIPNYMKNYFENIFYNNFPSSEIIVTDTIPWSQAINFVVPHTNAYFFNQKHFERELTYIDPFQNTLSFFNSIDEHYTANLYLTIQFEPIQDTEAKILLWLKKLYYILWHSSKQANELWYANVADGKKWTMKVQPELFFSLWFDVYANKQEDESKQYKQLFNEDMKSIIWWFTSDNNSKLTNKEVLIPWMFDQVVNLFHIPSGMQAIKWLDYVLYKKLQYPNALPTPNNTEKNEITILWETDYRSKHAEFGIRAEDKFRHMYVVGKTWTWKTTLLSNMVQSDMAAGNWLCLLDPHGDLIDEILTQIPSFRINDIVLFDVADTEFPIGFNLLQATTTEEKNLIVSWIVGAFYKLFDYSRWPRLEYILRNVFLSLVEYPNATLVHSLKILTDNAFRKEVLSYVKDKIILDFWHTEFDKRNTQQREIAIWPITNKIWQFLSSKIVRNIFGQPSTKLNLRKIMDEWKIVLVNLSKWKIWEDNSHMIGSLLVTKFQIDAMSRANIPYDQRKDFFLYIDEFQNFATKSFATILSEARKYKLSIILANQYTSQIMPEIKDAIFGNVWTTISFNIWNEDAKIISQQFKNLVSVDDLTSLPKYKAYVRLMINGIISDPFSITTKPLKTTGENIPDLIYKVKSQSRQRYAMPKEEFEKLVSARDNKSHPEHSEISKNKRIDSSLHSEWQIKGAGWQTAIPSAAILAASRLTELKNQKDIISNPELNRPTSQSSSSDISIWTRYDTTIKLKYNYWLFLSYNWAEWLLHKNLVNIPEWVDRKKFFNIWDKVRAKAIWYKEIEWEQKIVWTMLE